MRRQILVTVLCVCVAVSTQCTGPQESTSAAVSPPAGDLKSLAEANNAFALDLYGRLKVKEGNVFISPYSIQTALLMTWAGAKGKTAEEMYAALHLPQTKVTEHAQPVAEQPQPWLERQEPWPDQQIRDSAAKWIKNIDSIGQEGKVQLNTANAIWPAIALLDNYVKLVKDSYGANAQNVTYPEPGRTIINTWVEKKTNDKIKELLKPNDVQGLPPPVLVLTNAIYFKGEWAAQFDKKLTRDEPFHISPDKTINVPMMHRTDNFGYFETPLLHGPKDAAAKAQLLELPYKGERLSMVIILPDSAKPESLQVVEANLSGQLSDWLKGMQKQRVAVSVPRWKMDWRDYLQQPLQDMGMKLAFTGQADFSGMNGRRDLFISLVIHQSFVEVNEEGTEAAAATAVIMARKAAVQTAEFRVDRPFLFLIRDRQTGAILFIGRIAQPTQT